MAMLPYPNWQQGGGGKHGRSLQLLVLGCGKCCGLLHLQAARPPTQGQLSKRDPRRGRISPGVRFCVESMDVLVLGQCHYTTPLAETQEELGKNKIPNLKKTLAI